MLQKQCIFLRSDLIEIKLNIILSSRCTNQLMSHEWYLVWKLSEILHTAEMEFCKQYKSLPTLVKRIVWSWRAGNGTVFQVPENDLHLPAGCLIELINISVAILTTLIATILIFKYKCSAAASKLTKRRNIKFEL